MRLLLYIIALTIFTQILNAQPFNEVAAQKGITKLFGSGTFGGGISFCDFNQDGWDDLTFASQNGDSIYFYLNVNGDFQLLPALVSHVEEAKQVLWIDYDNDGDKDFFVTTFGGTNRLYQNTGNLVLVDVTQTAGFTINDNPTFGGTFGDYDKDGWLDLYVVNRNATARITNYLFRNKGDGTYEDVTTSTMTADALKVPFCASFFDMNNNGWQDIYTASDRIGITNTLLRNDQNGQFSDITQSSGAGIAIDAMNVGLGDYDKDGDLDIYVTNTAGGGSVLLQNQGNEKFIDVTASSGTTWHETGWGGNFMDYDNDTDLDLYVSNAFNGLDNSNALFQNIGNGQFSLPFPNGLPGDTLGSFSNVYGDLNNDGFPDIAVSGAPSNPHMLWENTAATGNNWLKIRLVGVTSNRDGIGSWVEVYADGQKQVRYTYSGIAYLGQNTSYEMFGLGNTSIVDSIHIKWLNGQEDKYYDIPTNQHLELIEHANGQCPQKGFVYNTNMLDNTHQVATTFQTSGNISSGSNVIIEAGEAILLKPGFTASLGADFLAQIKTCVSSNTIISDKKPAFLARNSIENLENNLLNLTIFPNPVQEVATISYSLSKDQYISLSLYDLSGKKVAQIIDRAYQSKGKHSFPFKPKKRSSGTYILKLSTEKEVIATNVVIP